MLHILQYNISTSMSTPYTKPMTKGHNCSRGGDWPASLAIVDKRDSPQPWLLQRAMPTPTQITKLGQAL